MDFGSYNPKFEKNALSDEPISEIPIKYYGDNQPGKRLKPPKKSRKSLFIFISIVAVCLIVLIVVYFAAPSPKNNSKTSTNSKTSSNTNNGPKTLSFNSVSSSLSFNYLSTWAVNDNNNGLITISSPVTSLNLASGSKTTGQVVITINEQTNIPKQFGNYSVALSNSTQISYSNPTQTQRNQTYLTYVQYPATTISGGLDAIYVTGDYAYPKNNVIPETDIAKLNPLIIVSFQSCQDSSCQKNTPVTVSSSTYSSPHCYKQ